MQMLNSMFAKKSANADRCFCFTLNTSTNSECTLAHRDYPQCHASTVPSWWLATESASVAHATQPRSCTPTRRHTEATSTQTRCARVDASPPLHACSTGSRILAWDTQTPLCRGWVDGAAVLVGGEGRNLAHGARPGRQQAMLLQSVVRAVASETVNIRMT